MFQRIAILLAVVACISRRITGYSEFEQRVFTDCCKDYLTSTIKDFVCSEQTSLYQTCVLNGLSLNKVPAKDQAIVEKARRVICFGKKPFAFGTMTLEHAFQLGSVTNPIQLMEKFNNVLHYK